MKTFRKIALAIVIIIVLSLSGGYLYFEKKFAPPENYLSVSGFTKNVVIRWVAADGNPYAAVLLPVQIAGMGQTFYMQLDSGSPTTVFYKKALASLPVKFRNQLQGHKNPNEISTGFNIGNMQVTSDRFTVLDYGNKIDIEHPDADNIIGTIGTDLLEKRTIVLDFKNSLCSFTADIRDGEFTGLEFKKRRIIFPATIGNESLKLLYDSGTSGYELITNKKEWESYKTPNGKIKTEKGNSWGNILTVRSAPAALKIKIGNRELKLSEVTYIEGTSAMQNFLMKRSGMQGMTGNKLFINHKLILDCKNKKFKVE